MPSTAVYGWPYPAPSAPNNVPLDLQSAMEAVEATVGNARKNVFIQGSRQIVTTSGTGAYNITFPAPFAAAPVSVVACDGDSSGAQLLQVGLTHVSVTATGLGGYVRTAAGAVFTGSMRLAWTATGTATTTPKP